jgi:hypothetical protein
MCLSSEFSIEFVSIKKILIKINCSKKNQKHTLKNPPKKLGRMYKSTQIVCKSSLKKDNNKKVLASKKKESFLFIS